MTRVKNSLKVLLLIALAVILTGCSIGPINIDLDKWFHVKSVQEAIQEKREARQQKIPDSALHTAGTLTVGLRTQSVTAPMIVASEGGTLQGIDVEVASAIADQLGVDVKFVSVNGPVDGLQAGCDIVMDVRSGEDSTSTLISGYAESTTALFHKGSETDITADSLSGKSVGVQTGSLSERAMGQVLTGMSVQGFSNLNDAFEALENGSIDYVACDAYAGAYLAANKDISMVGVVDVPTTIGISVATSNKTLVTQIQQALSTIQADGVEGVIRNKWVGTLPHLSTTNKIPGLVEVSTQSTSADSTASSSEQN
ncbi:MAG: amino acid ABC transporter substrate-binding protein [Atopobium sp.]|nr:amino acid ABC transporter substrate-binding protein [Atopobium sp.]